MKVALKHLGIQDEKRKEDANEEPKKQVKTSHP